MHKKQFCKILGAVSFIASMSVSGLAQASNLMIDNFTDSQRVEDRGGARPGSGSTYAPGATSNTLTGISGSGLTNVTRIFSAEATEGSYGNKEQITSGEHSLKISNSAGSAGKASVQWNFDLMNFTLHGNAMLLKVLEIDSNVNIEMVVNGFSSSGYTTLTKDQDLWLNFSAFSDPDEFTKVTSFRLNFTGPLAWDGQFQLLSSMSPITSASISQVPLPPAFAMMGSALLGLVGVSRLRKTGS